MSKPARTVSKKTPAKKVPAKKVNIKTGKKRSISKKIVQKKPYVELIAGLLSIPFLITVLVINLTTISNLNAKPTPTPEPSGRQQGGFFAAPVEPNISDTPSSTIQQSSCKNALGPVDITSPKDNDTVTDNPVIINIEYDDSEYCGAAWSYRINGGSWSGYDDRSVALYNLPKGQVTFELRVKSIVTSDERTLTRKFIYDGRGTVLVPDPNSSGSAN